MPSSSVVAATTSRTVPLPTTDPSGPGYDAFASAIVGDCVYYTKETSIKGMIKAPCDDPRVNARVTKRTLDPSECKTGWVGQYTPQSDYSKPILYDLVLCLEAL